MPPHRMYWDGHEHATSLEHEHQEVTWRLVGELAVGALRDAVAQLSARQEAFRSRFEIVDARLWLVVDPNLGIELTEHDARDGSAERRIQDWRLQRTDLEHGPLARAMLNRCGEREWLFSFVAHHIVFDGLSYVPLAEDLWELYAAAVERRAPRLPPIEIRLSDFLRWKQRVIESEAGREQAAFWQEHMAGFQPVALRTDRPRGPLEDRLAANPHLEFRSGTLPIEFSQQLLDSIKSLSIAARVTRSIVILGAFLETLHRATGQTDLQILSSYASRDSEELARLVGMFSNFMPLRVRISDELSVTDMLKTLQRDVLAQRSRGAMPVFGVAIAPTPPMTRINFNYLPGDQFLWSSDAPRAPGLVITIEPDLQWSSTSHDLGMFLNDTGGTAVFNAELFDATTVQRLVADFLSLGNAMAAAPSSRLGHV